jgi:hypothetical protein
MELKTITLFTGLFTAVSATLQLIALVRNLPQVNVLVSFDFLSRVWLSIFLFVLYARQLKRQ